MRDAEDANERKILTQAIELGKLRKENGELKDKLKQKEKEEVKQQTEIKTASVVKKSTTTRKGAGDKDEEDMDDIRAL